MERNKVAYMGAQVGSGWRRKGGCNAEGLVSVAEEAVVAKLNFAVAAGALAEADAGFVLPLRRG